MKQNYNCITFSDKISLKKLYEIFNKKKRYVEHGSVGVCLSKNKVLGLITLGDLRRVFEKKKNINNSVKNFLKKEFFFINEKDLNPGLNYKINNITEKKPFLKKIFSTTVLLKKDCTFEKIIDLNKILTNPDYKNICIIGMGYVGLSLTAHLLKKKNCKIIGVDNNLKKIKLLKKGKIDFFEKNLENRLLEGILNKQVNFRSNLKKNEAQIYIVCIGSEISKNKVSNTNLKNILKKISKLLKPQDLIILRGTLQVGFSRHLAVKILESKNNLICGNDFYLSYCPERIVEGDAINELGTLPQLVSAFSENCMQNSLNFIRKFFNKRLVLYSLEEAEIIKLASNSFRDLSFAFSNELSRLCSIYNINTRNLISNANSDYPRSYVPFPSVGVGGSCLIKDPILFSKLINNKNKGYQFGKLSRAVNNYSIENISKKIIKLSKINSGKKVLILGIAFKGSPETSDTRYSPSLILGRMLQRAKLKVYFHDKIIKKNKYSEYNLKNQILDTVKNFGTFDYILIINNNNYYSELISNNLKKKQNNRKKFLLDVWNLMDKNTVESLGYQYLTI